MTVTISMIRKLMKTYSYLPNQIIQKHANRIAEVVANETDCQEQYEYYRFPIYIGYSDQFIVDAYLNIDKIKDFLTSNNQKPQKFLLEDFTFGTRHQGVTDENLIACTKIKLDPDLPISSDPIIVLRKDNYRSVIDGNTRTSFAEQISNNLDILGYELDYENLMTNELYLNEYSKRLLEFNNDLNKFYKNTIE